MDMPLRLYYSILGYNGEVLAVETGHLGEDSIAFLFVQFAQTGYSVLFVLNIMHSIRYY